MKRCIFGKCVQGASHRRTGKECQDSRKYEVLPDGTIIAAVADGHGSASCPYSKEGSAKAVNVFCEVMKELYLSYVGEKQQLLTYLNREGDTRIARTIDEEWKKRILEWHKAKGRPWPEVEDPQKAEEEIHTLYGTTLVGLLLAPTFVFAFQIGDGDIAYMDENGFSHPLETEVIYGVETNSLCLPNAWKKAVTSARRWSDPKLTPSLFMLSTDGFANSYPSDEAYRATCLDYFQMLKQYGPQAIRDNLESWLNETSTGGCGDDITLTFIYSYD